MIIKPEDIIINRRENQTTGHRALSLILFLMFWAGLLYMLRPVLIILGWALAYFVFDSVASHVEGMDIVRAAFTEYLPMIVGLSLALVSWALYNRMRFSGSRDKRRVPPSPLTLEEISSATRLGLAKIQEMRAAPLMICYFDEERGEMLDAKCCFDQNQVDRFLPSRLRDDAEAGGPHPTLAGPRMAPAG